MLRILVLDDQPQYCRSLSRALRREYDVLLAHTVAEAKDTVSSGASVVLSDIRLDEANRDDRQGLEFLRWLRARDKAIPIVAMSALDDPNLETEALAAGATLFIRKPILISQLKAVLRQLTQLES